MHDDVLKTIARKKQEIEERQKDIAELEELLRLADKHRLSVSVSIGAELTRINSKFEAQLGEPQTLRERIVAGSLSVLSDGRRRLAREILPELEKLGIKLEGKNPSSNLSSYLSREKEIFVSDVKMGGWTLRHLAHKARTLDVGASRVLFTN